MDLGTSHPPVDKVLAGMEDTSVESIANAVLEEAETSGHVREAAETEGAMDAVLAEPIESIVMDVMEGEGDGMQDAVAAEQEPAESQGNEPGKRVKVYELTGQEWQERGTGFVDGTYDNHFDEAHLVVWWEADPEAAALSVEEEGSTATGSTNGDDASGVEKDKSESKGADTGPGGFVRDGDGEEKRELLRTRVLYNVPYQRQQDTLIVWTEPDGTDKALSFQDPMGCNNMWDFIQEVQQHMRLLNQTDDQGRSSPILSPPHSHDNLLTTSERDQRAAPTLSLVNLREQDAWIKSQMRSPAGKEKLAEALISVDWLGQMVRTFGEAEDLESLEDLHCLCSMLQSILALNDNSVYDCFVQDRLFLDLCGILEYDPEYPHYKAAYRDFLRQPGRFQEVIHFDDVHILTKIHHTYRLQYLKDVILARTLDDPTFNIINSLLFFNQIDIVTHVQNNDPFLRQLFDRFQPARMGRPGKAPEPLAESPEELVQKRNIVKFLHSLVNMGKQIQLPNRSALYRKLLEKGLLVVVGWAFKQEQSDEPGVRECLGKAVEMFGQILEHDVNAIKTHVNAEKEREKETGQKSLLQGMIALLVNHNDIGVKSQMSDAIRILLDIPEGFEAAARIQKDAPVAEAFAAYFFDSCAKEMYKPLTRLPEFSKVRKDRALLNFKQQQLILLQYLCELLSGFIAQHGHRSQYFILSQNLSVQVASVLYTRYKPLRHAALKVFKACIKTNNHFINRHLAKNDLMLPILDVLEFESARDNMLTAVCLEILELLRTLTMKTIINYMFEKHQAKLMLLEDRPSIQHFIRGLRLRWEQINEPPPQDTPKPSVEDQPGWSKSAMEEDDYFNISDEESPIIGPPAPSSTSTSTRAPSPPHPKLKRKASSDPTMSGKRLAVDTGGKEPVVKKILGLNYGDDSDSDSDARSPKGRSEGGRGLAPSPMDVDDSAPSMSTVATTTTTTPTPRIRLKLSSGSSSTKDTPKDASKGEDLGEFAAKLLQKRKRAEEEEEQGGFGSLMSGGRPGTPRGMTKEKDKKADASGGSGASSGSGSGGGSSKSGNLLKDAGRQIKLKMGGIGRKLGGNSNSDGGKKDDKEKEKDKEK